MDRAESLKVWLEFNLSDILRESANKYFSTLST
jgi:hypothetical protein